jgi:hypothetical protein
MAMGRLGIREEGESMTKPLTARKPKSPLKRNVVRKTGLKKRKSKSLSKLKDDLWHLFSLWIRVTYSHNGYVTCYTCGKKCLVKECQAGHGISGRGNAILFEPLIVRPQCVQCNIYKHGNYEAFIPKLIREIGLEKYEELVRMSKQPVKRTRAYYETEIIKYKEFLRIP